MAFDPSVLAGPLGGLLAVAFGAGASSGYAFCLRTMYKIIKEQAQKDDDDCKREVQELKELIKAKDSQNHILQERLIHGISRQGEQIERAGLYLLNRKDEDK